MRIGLALISVGGTLLFGWLIYRIVRWQVRLAVADVAQIRAHFNGAPRRATLATNATGPKRPAPGFFNFVIFGLAFFVALGFGSLVMVAMLAGSDPNIKNSATSKPNDKDQRAESPEVRPRQLDAPKTTVPLHAPMLEQSNPPPSGRILQVVNGVGAYGNEPILKCTTDEQGHAQIVDASTMLPPPPSHTNINCWINPKFKLISTRWEQQSILHVAPDGIHPEGEIIRKGPTND